MKTRLLNQPDDCQLADAIKGLLAKPEILKFDALVAFAVSSGVQELFPELQSLLGRGGSVQIVVGVSNKVTTFEGLKLLLELVRKGAKVFVFHNDNAANPIFHPKLYLFRGKDDVVLIVGSSNMTGKGLVGNYEISLLQEFNLKSKPDAEVVLSAEKIISNYCDLSGGLTRELTEEFLRELEAEGYLGSEQLGTQKSETSAEADTAAAATPRKRLFKSKAVPQPSARKLATAASGATARVKPSTMTNTGTVVDCFWKALSWNDINPKGSPGQIIIPIQFRDVFPPVIPTPAYAARKRGRQLECSFAVIFEDSTLQIEAPNARFIIYEPLPGHPRPNTEARFTFRNRPLFDRLSQDDVLVFERLKGSTYAFRVRLVRKGTQEYRKLSPGSGKQNRFGSC